MAGSVRLEHVAIPATEENFETLKQFYCDVFGWQVIKEMDGPPHIAFVSDGHGGRLEIYTAPGSPMQNPVHMAFAVPVDEFDELRDRVASAGIALNEETSNPVGDRLIYFKDPAGNDAQIVGRNQMLPD